MSLTFGWLALLTVFGGWLMMGFLAWLRTKL